MAPTPTTLVPAGSTPALVTELTARVRGGTARAGTGRDVADGVRPRLVAEPVTPEGLAESLAWATSEGLRVLVAGGRTKLDWGAASGPIDLLLSTARLDRVVEHRHGDLTATVEAGATLSAVNAALAAHGQRLPWDPPWPDRATVGGIVATNDSGPRRHGHGAPRDSIIGVTVARADGRVARAGGIVVKNVAGYDLSRLLTGSFGCLGVILTATFKLAPAPPASRTLEVTVDSLEQAASVAADLAAAPLTPTALEVSSPPVRLLARFESVEASVSEQVEAARTLVGTCGSAATHAGADEQAVWDRHAAHWYAPGTLVKLATVPAELFPTLVWLRGRAADAGVELAAAGRAGLGVVDLRLDGPLEAQAAVVAELRARLPLGRGSAVIRRGEPELRRQVGAWGPIGDALPVMQAIKRRFDPEGTLNPGRGPGGL
ncbi:MAG: FAD-binding oxidoreductase [Acidobacteria bacterium]|nr:FAD-binding oxidoreductase [Acidobacteriota bacterium]